MISYGFSVNKLRLPEVGQEDPALLLALLCNQCLFSLILNKLTVLKKKCKNLI